MNTPHFSAAALPLIRPGSALPASRSRFIVERKADPFPMVFAIAAPIQSYSDPPVNPAKWRVSKIVTDPPDELAVVSEFI